MKSQMAQVNLKENWPCPDNSHLPMIQQKWVFAGLFHICPWEPAAKLNGQGQIIYTVCNTASLTMVSDNLHGTHYKILEVSVTTAMVEH